MAFSSDSPDLSSAASNESSPNLGLAFVAAWRAAWSDRFIRVIWVVAAALAIVYSVVILIGYGPDEPRHMNFIKLLVEEQRLPFLSAPGVEYKMAHSLHPPLYYVILAPFYAVLRALPGESEWHVLRWLSGAFCLACVPLWFDTGRRAFADLWTARLGVAALALLPIFAMTSGVINNDSLTLFLVTLFLWMLACPLAHDKSWRGALLLGIVFGLGGATKATALICNGAALLVYLLWQEGKTGLARARFWSRLFLVLFVVLLICAWWYARNKMLYGQMVPTETGYALSDKLNLLPPLSMGLLTVIAHPNFPGLFAMTFGSIFVTLWSQKDWIPEALRPCIWLMLSLFCGLGIAATLWRARLPQARQTSALWPLVAAFAANALACLTMALFFHYGWAEGGRYLLPSLCGLVFPVALGWRALAGEKVRLVAIIWTGFLLFFNLLALYWLLAYLNPTYGPQQ